MSTTAAPCRMRAVDDRASEAGGNPKRCMGSPGPLLAAGPPGSCMQTDVDDAKLHR